MADEEQTGFQFSLPFHSFKEWFGAFILIYVIRQIYLHVKGLYFYKNNFRKYKKAGDWAVVTGASEGIGHAMALDLARRGFNVCVIARTQSKLDAVVSEIESLGVKGKSISFDFSAATEDNWKELLNKLNEIKISVLINNVGVNYEYTNYFHEVDLETDLRLIKVNTEATIRLTKYVLPNMKEARAGAIVCMGSASAVVPTPLLSTYAGTKAFNISFASSLHYELKELGIDVLAVAPNLVVSKMTQGRSSRAPKESFVMVNAAQMARKTLNQLGFAPVTAGHPNHCVLERVILLCSTNFVGRKCLALHKSIKRRAEKSSG